MKNTNKILKILIGGLFVCFVISLSLAIYYGLQIEDNENISREFLLKKAVNHRFDEKFKSKSDVLHYVLFTDPQLGLFDVVNGDPNKPHNWDADIEAIRKFGEKVDELNSNGVGLDFVMCLGDLNNAYPDDHDDEDEFKAAYRPAQTADLLEAFRDNLANDIPTFVLAGNHDITNHPHPLVIDGFEKTWGNSYYFYEFGGHYFIGLESEFFRLTTEDNAWLRDDHIKWLEGIFSEIPRTAAKHVFQHAPLFIKDAEETDSIHDGKTIMMYNRLLLLDIYCKNNVTHVFSGHTHFTHFPDEYNCSNGNSIKQIILTSISTQLEWTSYDGTHYPISNGTPEFLLVELEADGATKIIRHSF